MKSSKFECASPYFKHGEPNMFKTCAPFLRAFSILGEEATGIIFRYSLWMMDLDFPKGNLRPQKRWAFG